MKLSVFSLGVGISFATAGILNPRACAGDNCNRAITGTAAGTKTLAARIADCSSYFSVTVYPAPSIVTVTSTTTVSSGTNSQASVPTSTNVVSASTVTATAIPAYASAACNGNAIHISIRYSSACSCAKVTHATTTEPTPTSTITVTTTTVVSSATPTNFHIIAFSSINTTYLATSTTSNTLTFVPSLDLASLFRIYHFAPALETVSTATDPPSGTGLISSQGIDGTPGPVFFNTEQAIGRAMATDVYFTVGADEGGGLFALTGENPRTTEMGLFDCSGTFFLGATDFVRAGCVAVTLGVRYVA